MNNFVTALALGVLGLFVGSFVGATVWRLRARQLHEDEKAGDKVSATAKKQISKLKMASVLKDRSVCLHCGHQLQWFDLVPLVSWISLKGRCRYCHRKIGYLEPLVELTLGVFFAVSYLFWPMALDTWPEIVRLVLWLLTGVGLAILFVYDMKWFLLPNRIVFPLIGIGLFNSLVVLYGQGFAPEVAIGILYGCLVLSGLYYFIYVFSRHNWVGFGDVKLALALALILADWKLATLALFFANAIGTLVVVPLLLTGKITRKARIPFGPLLIAGWFFAGLFGTAILNWYLTIYIG